jgi:hypothetical protein
MEVHQWKVQMVEKSYAQKIFGRVEQKKLGSSLGFLGRIPNPEIDEGFSTYPYLN